MITFSERKGITLIALIITIIVLIILATVTIITITGENGIIKIAQDAKKQTEQKTLEEEVNLCIIERNMDTMPNGTKGILGEYLQKIQGATVKEVCSDENGNANVWHVTKKDAQVTVYDNGEIITGKIEVWNGTDIDVPEFKESNWYIYNCAQFKFFADFVNNGGVLTEDQSAIVTEKGYNEGDIKIEDSTIVYLMSDLDLGARQTNGELIRGTEWTPIGTTSNLKFTGTFEGNNHTIIGVYVNIEGNFAGIFGNSDTIQNLSIKDSYIKGKGCIGGIVAALREGNISNCHNIDTVILGEKTVGGIVGQITASTKISNCHNTGQIELTGTNSHTIGGIVGQTYGGGNIYNCNNSGKINANGKSSDYGNSQAGGIVGYITDTSTEMAECYNTGIVIGIGNSVGGIVGLNKGNITKCYNIAQVTGKMENIGGIAGKNSDGGRVEKCYNKGTIIYEESYKSQGEIIGLIASDSTVTQCYYLSREGTIQGVGAINDGGNLEEQNAQTHAIEVDLKTYEEFRNWIDEQ